jgi:16S rRNA processing protein RimM
MAGEPSSDWLAAGGVGRPHGLDGFIHVTRPRAALLDVGAVVMVGGSERRIVARKGTAAAPIVRLEGCETREAAQALRGETLLAPRTQAPALGEDEYWAEELEGCEVVDGDRVIGVVKRMLPLPSCEALEVERPDRPTLLVPLVRDAIREVDVGARRIDIRLAFVAPGEEA